MASLVKTFSISSKVCRNSAIHCSESGEFVIATKDGIQIMDFSQAPMKHTDQFSFTVTRIRNLDVPYQLEVSASRPDTDTIDNRGPFITDISMKLVYDRALNTRSDADLSRRGYTMAKWSPLGLDHINRCVIACLTLDHRLSIYSRGHKRHTWKEVLRLSDILSDHMKAIGYDCVKPGDKPRDYLNNPSLRFMKQVYAITVVDLAWSPDLVTSTDGTCQCGRLATATKSGHIVFWRIATPVTNSGADIEKIIALPDQSIVSSICWCFGQHQGFLTVGCVNGLIYTIDLQDYTVTQLWTTTDHVRVTHLVWLQELRLLVAGKGTYMILIPVTQDSSDAASVGIQCISNKMHITGLEAVSADSVYICTNDASVLIGRIVWSGSVTTAPSLTIEVMDFKRTSMMAMSGHGLAVSPNSLFIGLLESPAEMYCHLALKNPLKVQMVNLSTPDQVIQSILTDSLDSQRGLATALITLKYHHSQVQGWSEVEDLVQPIMKGECLQKYSPTQLKLARFILQLRQDHTVKTSSPEKTETDKVLECVTKAILMRYLATTLTMLTSTDINTLTDTELQSVTMCCTVLRESELMDDVRAMVERVEATLPDRSTASTQTCPICGKQVIDQKMFSATCPNGHEFSRCIQTMLVCHQVPYRVCVWCGAMAMSKIQDLAAHWLRKLQTDLCSLCGQSLIHCQ